VELLPRARFLAFAVFFALWPATAGAQAPSRPEGVPDDPELPRPGKIIVQVRSSTGVPVALAQVRLYSMFTSFNRVMSLGDSGQVTFDNVPSGEYVVEVRAAGFRERNDAVGMYMPGGTNYVHIELRPDSAADPAPIAPGPPLLTPRAKKELDAALAALNRNDLKEARARLEQAQKLAPNHPDVVYLLGVLTMREGNRQEARTLLERAASLDPKHNGALVALGGLLLDERDFGAAVPVLEQAGSLSPQGWRPHWLLASAYFEVGRLDDAQHKVEAALAMPDANGAPLRLLLARVYQARGERDRALGQAEAVARLFARSPQAAEAQALIAELREGERAEAAAVPASSRSAAVAAPEASLPPRRWLPPGIDEIVPHVNAEVPCSLPDVLAGVGRRARELVTNLERFAATERIEHAEIDDAGLVRSQAEKSFEYVAFIREVRKGMLSVEESRDGRASLGSFPSQMASRGLAAFGVLFHPFYVDDLEIRCEGLGRWRGQPAWQLYFRQREDRAPRFRVFSDRQRRAAIRMKGRAWVAVNSYHIVRLETEMMEPLRELAYDHEQFLVEYQPVHFRERNVQLWLPLNVELYLQFRGKRYRHRHSFSDYLLFSVDVGDRPRTPPPPEPDPAAAPPPIY
jgi:tetratricopeptide (TPR) repeat protein